MLSGENGLRLNHIIASESVIADVLSSKTNSGPLIKINSLELRITVATNKNQEKRKTQTFTSFFYLFYFIKTITNIAEYDLVRGTHINLSLCNERRSSANEVTTRWEI